MSRKGFRSKKDKKFEQQSSKAAYKNPTAKVGKTTSTTSKVEDEKKEVAKLRTEVNTKYKPKLILSEEFEKKVDYLHKNVIKNTEWSGIIIYSNAKASIDDPENWEILVEDIILMDIGSSAYTEYDMESDDVYATEKWMDALADGKKIGHCHTHHNMNCYFSGVDTKELHDNAPNHNYYLSLIVNYQDTSKWCAKVAVCGTEESTYDIKSVTTWKGASGVKTKKDSEKFTESKDLLFLMGCDITSEAGSNKVEELDDRIAEITELNRFKAAKAKPIYPQHWSKDHDDAWENWNDHLEFQPSVGYKSPSTANYPDNKSTNIPPLYSTKNIKPIFIKYLDDSSTYATTIENVMMEFELINKVTLANGLEKHFEENCLVEFFEEHLLKGKAELSPIQMHAIAVTIIDILIPYENFAAWKTIDSIMAQYLMEPEDYSKKVITTMTGVAEEDQAYLESVEL